MKLNRIFAVLAALAIAASVSYAQDSDDSKYWFAGAGAGMNFGFDGSKYIDRPTSGNGAGFATDIYVGKWFTKLVGMRAGWQGLTISDRYTDFGAKNFNYAHGDLLLRPVKFIVPYVHGGWLRIDRDEMAAGVGVMFPIHVGKVVSIVPDFKYTAFSHNAFKNGENNPGTNLSATIGLAFNLGGKKKKPAPVIVPQEVVRVVKDTVILRDTVYMKPDVVAKTAEVNEFLQNVTLFDFDSYEIKPEAHAGLNKVIDWMKRYPSVTAKVEGHTDNIGTEEYNVTLSNNRAKAIYDYLINGGIDASRLSYEGFGTKRPVTTNDTVEGRRQNRRIEIHFAND